MNSIQRKRYEMLLRVRDFGQTHGDLFSASTVAQQTFTTLGAAIDELAATDMRKMSASASARADRKAAARTALIDLLRRASQLARALRADGRTMPRFDLPRSKSDQALLTAGRQFAVDAAGFDAEFTGHGMGPAQISATTAAFETATNDRGMNRAGHVAAGARIQDLLASAMRDVRRLDLIVANDLPHDNVVQAVWRQARRVEDPRGARQDGEGDDAAGADAAAAGEPAGTAAPAPA